MSVQEAASSGVGATVVQVPHLPLLREHWHCMLVTSLHLTREPLPCTASQAFLATAQRTRLPPHRQEGLALHAPLSSGVHSCAPASASAPSVNTKTPRASVARAAARPRLLAEAIPRPAPRPARVCSCPPARSPALSDKVHAPKAAPRAS